MLQRAASNAYSWWWASHIRTKQSKWLEQNLQDMEEKVETVLKLISEDGDSFAKRAEMYYKKRPELINFVEESYRAYRALAERYDHISTELQNANNTIATVFPERVQFAMDEDDENGSPRAEKFPHAPKANIPKVPNLPSKNLKGLLISATKKLQAKKTSKGARAIAKSGLNKSEAVDEIDKLQKEILSIQTEKEFVKCSYEHGIAKYWEIEEQIKEKHNKICSLQDEFSVGSVIEDDEARTLMAAAALKSCQESLSLLQDKHEKSADEAKNEQKSFEDAWKKLHSLKSELLPNQLQQEKYDPTNDGEILFKNFDREHDTHAQEKQKLEALQEKFKEYLEVDDSNASVTVTEMAENIDKLVNKVIDLETAVLSQTALITRLRTETNGLQAQITSLEDDKANLINGSDGMSSKLREMEEKLHHIQDINRNVENQNENLHINFSQAQCSLDQLTGKLHSVKPDEEPETPVLSENEDGSQLDQLLSVKPDVEPETSVLSENENGFVAENGSQLDQPTGKQHSVKPNEEPEALVLPESENGSLAEEGSQFEVSVSLTKDHEGQSSPLDTEDGLEIKEKISEDSEENVSISVNKQEDEENDPEKQDSLQIDDNLNGDGQEHKAENEDEPNWQMLFMNGLEDREKMLLSQYTTSLRNCKDKKKQLDEKDVQLKELRNVNGLKDEEIQSLRQKLSFLVTTMADNPDLKELKDSYHHPTLNLLDCEDLEPITRSKEDEKDTRISAIEEKFRTKIDEVLENNLDFWLNFSSSLHQVQKFETSVQDLQAEIYKLEGKKLKKKQEGSTSSSLKSDARPLYKHLREIETEITLLLEHNAQLKDELQSRVMSLSNILEDISQALKVGCEDEEAKFNSYQAAKFQGEVLNMKQENAKVAEELQASLDHASALQVDIQKTLTKLDLDFELSGTKNHHHNFKHSISRSRIPLRSFLFGVKQKNKRANIFANMHPALLRKHNSDKKDEHTL